MGYESKITLAIEYGRPIGDIWNHVVASIDMGKMGYYPGWRELFTEPLVGVICLNLYNDFYIEDGRVEQNYTQEDPYGEKPTQATVESVYKWCEQHQDPDNFELCMLTDMLAAAMKSPMPLKVVHTGY